MAKIKRIASLFDKNIESILKKCDIVMKNGIAFKNDEKFTGTINRRFVFIQKEIITFVDGIINERIYYDIFNKEVLGFFYVEGNLHAELEKIKKDCMLKIYNDGYSLSREIEFPKAALSEVYRELAVNKSLEY